MLVICTAVVAVVVVTLLSVLFIRNAEHNQSDQLLLLLCETGEGTLDYYFNSVEKSVKNVAAYSEKELEGLEDGQLNRHAEKLREYFDRIANKTSGVLTYYYRIDPAISQTVKGFWYTNVDGRGFTEHAVTDITLYDTEDTSRLVWFTVPKHEGKAVWQPPYQTENLDMDVISYNMPVYWRGQFVGVIGIEIDYTTVAKQVESIHLYENGYAFLTDAEGRLIYHPVFDLAEMAEEDKPAMPDGVLRDNTFTEYTFNGVKKQAVWLRLTNGMRLYVAVPEDETDGDWKKLVGNVLIASAAVLVLCAVLAWIVSKRITKPLQQLTDAAKQADQGNYDFTLDYNGKDEVGTLTRTFKNMAEHMKAHISDLSRRANVDALTSVRNKGAFTSFIEDLQKKLEEDPDAGKFAVGVFDCDDLKTVNDRYGHDKGDIYLKTACQLICKVFQHSPVFRIGGDEFATVLRNDDFDRREELTEWFAQRSVEINAAAKNQWEQVHMAMGIAVYDPEKDRTVIDTVRRADQMMYTNKRAHKSNS